MRFRIAVRHGQRTVVRSFLYPEHVVFQFLILCDLNDESYKNLPSYHVAGTNYNVSKRYVAIYPSDLQCDPNDSAQVAKYEELKNYVLRIQEGSDDSPLAMPDSNPEPQ